MKALYKCDFCSTTGTEEEIYQHIIEDLYVNAYDVQRENSHEYICTDPAEHAEVILYGCPKCKKMYTFSRYPLSKLAVTKRVDSIGFNMLYEENRLAFKNITEAVIDKKSEKLIPICPHCGHNTLSE